MSASNDKESVVRAGSAYRLVDHRPLIAESRALSERDRYARRRRWRERLASLVFSTWWSLLWVPGWCAALGVASAFHWVGLTLVVYFLPMIVVSYILWDG
jgi:hypothetical protein